MIATIYVPLDGSAFAARALSYACVLARLSGARFVLGTSVPGEAHAFPVRGSAFDLARPPEPGEPDMLALVNRQADRLRPLGFSVSVQPCARFDESVADRLARSITEAQADLVVMATHGRAGLSRRLYGSVASDLLERLSVPLLLIPSPCKSPGPTQSLLHVLVPVDGSEQAERTAQAAATLFRELPAELVLLNVGEREKPQSRRDSDGHQHHELPSAAVSGDGAYVHEVANRLRRDGALATGWATPGRPGVTIARVAHGMAVDMIAVSAADRSTGRSPRRSEVLCHAATPVLVLPVSGACQEDARHAGATDLEVPAVRAR